VYVCHVVGQVVFKNSCRAFTGIAEGIVTCLLSKKLYDGFFRRVRDPRQPEILQVFAPPPAGSFFARFLAKKNGKFYRNILRPIYIPNGEV
jgi:hypothetical protein